MLCHLHIIFSCLRVPASRRFSSFVCIDTLLLHLWGQVTWAKGALRPSSPLIYMSGYVRVPKFQLAYIPFAKSLRTCRRSLLQKMQILKRFYLVKTYQNCVLTNTWSLSLLKIMIPKCVDPTQILFMSLTQSIPVFTENIHADFCFRW